MASSKKTEDGIVEITAPGGTSAYPVGMRFVVAGSAAEARFGFGASWPDWCLRLVDPLPPWRGKTSGVPNHEPAQQALLEQLRSRELHPSLIAEPGEPGAEPLAA